MLSYSIDIDMVGKLKWYYLFVNFVDFAFFTFISKGPWTYGNAGYNGPYYHKCLQFSGVSSTFIDKMSL